MSATATPYGMRPVGVLGSRPNNHGVTSYAIASGSATLICYGDVVKQLNTGFIDKDIGTATLTPIGVFVGCAYTDPTTKQKTFSQFWPAATVASDAIAYVVDDPFAVFQIQASAACAQTTLGNNGDLIITAGNTTYGLSRNTLNGVTVPDTVSTRPLRIVDFVDGPFSTVGDAFTDLVVKFNNHTLTTLTGV